MATTKRKARTTAIDTMIYAITHELRDREGFYYLKRKGCPVKTFEVKGFKPRLAHDEQDGYRWVLDLTANDGEVITIDKDTVSLAYYGWMNGEDDEGTYQEVSVVTLFGKAVSIKEVDGWIDKNCR